MLPVTRRGFFGMTAIGATIPFVLTQRGSHAAGIARWIEGGLPDNFPSQDYESVSSAVGMSHTNLDGVRELVTGRPALAKATWDWGFGDWETALGACSHTGRRDIAEFLIAHGARPDLFTFAMLGQVDVVRAVCNANPGIQKIHGPHGITLMQHAVNGGDEAQRVVDYLRELGDADIATEDLPLDEAEKMACLGEYESGALPGTKFVIGFHERRKMLTLTVGKGSMRFICHHGNHEFSPVGAAAVRIVFDLQDGVAKSLTIRDGTIHVTSRRIAA
jgi:hypothetical protein